MQTSDFISYLEGIYVYLMTVLKHMNKNRLLNAYLLVQPTSYYNRNVGIPSDSLFPLSKAMNFVSSLHNL